MHCCSIPVVHIIGYAGAVHMETILKINTALNGFVWGAVMLALFIIVGLYLSIKTGFVQTRAKLVFKNTIGKLLSDRKRKKGNGLSPFQAMTTALAGTVGTGNIAGVTGAIFIGGAGSIFWMWVSAILGMCTKYAEITLAVHYRRTDRDGTHYGGPMYYIESGLGARWRILAMTFAFLCCAASLGIGNMTQSSEIAGAAKVLFNLDRGMCGIIISLVVGLVVLGGIRRIGAVTSYLVPIMSILYILAGLFIIIVRAQDIPRVLYQIVSEAFTGRAMGGGVVGFGALCALKQGFARGVFSNEAGLGSAPIAHAAADTDEPCEQAMWGVFEVFIDTIVICSITAFAVLLSGITETSGGLDAFVSGGAAAGAAFNAIIPHGIGGALIQISLIFFAFSSIICWCYYGERCADYLFHGKQLAGVVYKLVFISFCYFGAVGSASLVWDISDTLNGLMAIPNLIALLLLSGTVGELTQKYINGE